MPYTRFFYFCAVFIFGQTVAEVEKNEIEQAKEILNLFSANKTEAAVQKFKEMATLIFDAVFIPENRKFLILGYLVNEIFSIYVEKPINLNVIVANNCHIWLCKNICELLKKNVIRHSGDFISLARELLDELPIEFWPYIPRLWLRHICDSDLLPFKRAQISERDHLALGEAKIGANLELHIFGNNTPEFRGFGFTLISPELLAEWADRGCFIPHSLKLLAQGNVIETPVLQELSPMHLTRSDISAASVAGSTEEEATRKTLTPCTPITTPAAKRRRVQSTLNFTPLAFTGTSSASTPLSK